MSKSANFADLPCNCDLGNALLNWLRNSAIRNYSARLIANRASLAQIEIMRNLVKTVDNVALSETLFTVDEDTPHSKKERMMLNSSVLANDTALPASRSPNAYDAEAAEHAANLALLAAAIERAPADRRPLMCAHLRAQRQVWTIQARPTDFVSDEAYQKAFDEAVGDEMDAREALAQSSHESAEAFFANVKYLNALCRIEGTLPLIGDDYGAVAIAVDAFLQERAA